MKKYILLSLAAVFLLAGCTTKEQDQQIRLFWLQQYGQLMSKMMLQKMPQLQNLQKKAANATPQATQTTPAQQRPQPAPQPQLMDVTLDSAALPGRAPQADRVRMKRALEAVQLSNQKTLVDIAAAFGGNVKNQALILTAGTERQLKQAATEAATFTDYFTKQQQLLRAQEQSLNDLMKQNAASIRKIRTQPAR